MFIWNSTQNFFSGSGEMKEVKKKSFRLKTIRSEALFLDLSKKKFNCREEKRDKIEVMKLANLDFFCLLCMVEKGSRGILICLLLSW